MPKRITSVKGLPPEFNLEKYSALEGLSVEDFLNQVDARGCLWMSRIHGNEKYLQEIKKILLNPIVSRTEAMEVDAPYSMRSVSMTTVGCTLSIIDDLRRAGDAVSDAVQAGIKTDAQHQIIDSPVDIFSDWPETTARINIDLYHSDEQILDDLRQLLPVIRKTKGVPYGAKDLKLPEIKKAIENRVIPYLDLEIWAEITGVKITQNTMGNALFPDTPDIDTTEKIRRTVRPLAHEVMKHGWLRIPPEYEPNHMIPGLTTQVPAEKKPA